MTDYTLAVGTHDPQALTADTLSDALRQAVGHVERRHAEDLRRTPEAVVTLLGPEGLVTRPSERLDEFVRREPGPHPGLESGMVRPGDTNTPDCNGD